jgi:alkanesulfonate monooxygenase SsuD/methylene tetrahydromethanopterin reductase-like flavin-dependent oxidoreductase (luciferase family)
MMPDMHVDVLFDPFGAHWDDVLRGALVAEEAGIDGVWLYDHLAGSVHGESRVLECWTTLTALAAGVPRLMFGPMVLNVANRDAGTLAVMAATFQEISGGRLLLGVGAGGGADTSYAREQWALGRDVGPDPVRRAAVESTITQLRSVWANDTVGASGFLVPRPAPPIVVGGFGPKMAALAGQHGDGMNAPGGAGLGRLIDVARRARVDAGRDPDTFVVTASASPTPSERERLTELGVHRIVAFVPPPYVDGVRRIGDLLAG